MGLSDLIATDEAHYVRMAVRLGTDRVYRESIQKRIRENVHVLFHRDEAVDEWTALLTRLAEQGPADDDEQDQELMELLD